jgi:hypothetical protein
VLGFPFALHTLANTGNAAFLVAFEKSSPTPGAALLADNPHQDYGYRHRKDHEGGDAPAVH